MQELNPREIEQTSGGIPLFAVVTGVMLTDTGFYSALGTAYAIGYWWGGAVSTSPTSTMDTSGMLDAVAAGGMGA